MERDKIAPLPWKIKQFKPYEKYCIVDNEFNAVVPMAATMDMEDLEYIVEACNEYPLLKETCNKMVEQDGKHFETINYYQNCNDILTQANDQLLDTSKDILKRLRIAVTYLKQLDTKEATEMIELITDGIKLE